MVKSGIVKESNKAYHGDKGAISKSRLSKMSICPAYFKWCENNEQTPTDDMVLGSAFHKLVLEEDTFGTEFIVIPPIDRRTKLGKEQYETFLKMADGKSILTQEQFDIISKMRDSVMSNKNASKLLDGAHENSMYGEDELTGERIKTRPDCFTVHNDRLLIVDLKSCKSAMADDFTRDVVKLSYDLQAFMYSYNASQVLNIPLESIDFLFIAVEKKPPYLVNVYKANKYVLERGEALYRQYIGMYHEAKITNNWWGLNGKQDIINELSLPEYLLKGVKDNG